ncbi:MAG: ABC transporter permease [Gammaproteobacteria bacterium]
MFSEALLASVQLILAFDHELVAIVVLSLQVSLLAVALATLIGLPLGALVAVFRFPGRGLLVALLNALMGLPPVVVGLVVYLLLSRAGPLGPLGLLFTPTAMVIAQCILVTPIIAALTRQTVNDLRDEYAEQLQSLGCRRDPCQRCCGTAASACWTAVLAGFLAVPAQKWVRPRFVGGNINHVTRA